jgi:glyoxylase-like metal-dependent hydrolase (beta-lactamase superfamily II)
MQTPAAVKRFVSRHGVRVYQIPCQVLAQLTGRVHLLLGAGVPTLVDTGSGLGESTQDILAGIASVRSEFGEAIQPADIRRIVISHAHVDHFGGLAGLLREMPAQVAVHPLECRAITAYDEYAIIINKRLDRFLQEAGLPPDRRNRLVTAFGLPPKRFPNLPVDILLEDGQDFGGMRIIHTPGHAPGHVCLGIDNLLVCADHLLSRTIPQQWPEGLTPYAGMGHYFESLDKIQAMPGFDLALAGHEMVMHDLYHRIDVIRAGLVRRLDRIAETLTHAAQPLSISEITRRLYPDAEGLRAVLAVTDVGARIEYLYQRGRLTVTNLDEVRRDEPPIWRYVA